MSGNEKIHVKDFKRLFDTYKKKVHAYVLAISHSPYVAEEITQEIFMKLWICRDRLNQVEKKFGYVWIPKGQVYYDKIETTNFHQGGTVDSRDP